MNEKTGDIRSKWIKEHFSISVSLIVILLLILSGRLSYSLEIIASLAIVGGVIFNYLLCRKLGKCAREDTED